MNMLELLDISEPCFYISAAKFILYILATLICSVCGETLTFSIDVPHAPGSGFHYNGPAKIACLYNFQFNR